MSELLRLLELAPDDNLAVAYLDADRVWHEDKTKVSQIDKWSANVKSSGATDLYFASRPMISGRSRSNLNVASVTVLVAEIDLAAPGAPDRGLATLANARTLLQAVAPLLGRPVALVDSGAGLHVYWLLARPTDRYEGAYVQLRLHHYLAAVAESLGVGALDKVADLARVLRLPDSTNTKYLAEHNVSFFVRLLDITTVVDAETPVRRLTAQELLTAIEDEIGPAPQQEEIGADIVSPHVGWKKLYANRKCNYSHSLPSQYVKDYETGRIKQGNRHIELINIYARILALCRVGCLDYLEAQTLTLKIAGTYKQHPGGNSGEALDREIVSAYYWAREKIQRKSAEAIIAEDLHGHDPQHRRKTSVKVDEELSAQLNEYGYPGSVNDLPLDIKFQVWLMKLTNSEGIEEGVAKLTGVLVIAGLGSVGKSTLVLWIMCRLTKGELLGHWFGKPQYVVIFTKEDSLSEVVLAKIRRMGGDPSKFKTYNAPDGKRFNIEEYTEYIDKIMSDKRYDFAFGLIEAASMHLYGPGSRKEKDVGNLLLKLGDKLESQYKSVAMLLPVNKAEGSFDMIIKSIMGESDWVNNVRLVLLVAYADKAKVEVTDTRYLSVIKTNNGESQKMRHFAFDVDYVYDNDNKRIPNPDDPSEFLKSVNVKWLPELDKDGNTAQAKLMQERTKEGKVTNSKEDKDADLFTTLKACAEELYLVNLKLFGEKSGLLEASPLFLAINDTHSDFWTNTSDPQQARRKVERLVSRLPDAEIPFEFVAHSKPLKIQLSPWFLHKCRPESELGKQIRKSI